MLPQAHGAGRRARGHAPARRARRRGAGPTCSTASTWCATRRPLVGRGRHGSADLPDVRRPQRPRHRRPARGDARGRRRPAGAGLVDGGLRRGPLRLPRARRPAAPGRGSRGDLDAGRLREPLPASAAARSDWALVDEDARLDPRSAYAASKVAQEHYAAAWARQAGGVGGRAALPQRLRARDAAGHAVLRGRGDVPLRRSSAASRRGSSRTAGRCATSCTSTTWPGPTCWRSTRWSTAGAGAARPTTSAPGTPVSILDVARAGRPRHRHRPGAAGHRRVPARRRAARRRVAARGPRARARVHAPRSRPRTACARSRPPRCAPDVTRSV